MIIFDEDSKKTLIQLGNGDISIFTGLRDEGSVGLVYFLDSLGTFDVGATLYADEFGLSDENLVEKSNVVIRISNKRSLRVLIDALISLYGDMNDR